MLFFILYLSQDLSVSYLMLTRCHSDYCVTASYKVDEAYKISSIIYFFVNKFIRYVMLNVASLCNNMS